MVYIYILLLSIISLIVVILYKRKIYIWLPDYIFGDWKKKYSTGKPIHLMLCFVDHFEPHNGKVSDEISQKRMDIWLDKYPKLARNFLDSDGNYLKHTWFYPYDELCEQELEQLNTLCREGFGEVEFHLHHKNDTPNSLREKLNMGLEKFNEFGISMTTDGEKKYAFIHGNWALANSVVNHGENYCGVNNELQLLNETGCFADFTFPAYMSMAQPALINSLYYSKGNKNKPKSYNKGFRVEKNKKQKDVDLMLVQGPLRLNWKIRKYGIFPKIEDGNIHKGNLFHKSKVDLWVDTAISVKNKNDWLFLKIFTHGAPEKNHNAVLGEDANSLFNYICKKYNDKRNYVLHFVTAREMYNIIKAAEDGMDGNPNEYRDYEIKPYLNTIMGEKNEKN